MSVNDRRASYMGAPRPRVVSNRVDAERPSRGAASPQQPDNMDSLRTSTSSQKQRLPREQKNMTEKRTERTVITTREKAVRRNPVKESSSASNRGEWDKSRTKKTRTADGMSPAGHKREQDAPNGSWLDPICAVDVAFCFGIDIDMY
jgi:gamma-tubulin complex component 2